MSFEQARTLADAVLLEGYVLYPYRASSTKNQFRWAFGVLAPRTWSEAGGSEPWWLEAHVLVEPGGRTALDGRLRFLQSQTRRIEVAVEGGGFRPVESLEVEGQLLLPWDEGDVRELELGQVLAGAAAGREVSFDFEVPGAEWDEQVPGVSGAPAGRVLRRRLPLRVRVQAGAEPVQAERPLMRLRLRVENVTPWESRGAPRDEALQASCIATHLLLSVQEGAFLSLLDPPQWAQAAAATCANVRTFPVLAGPAGRNDVLLSAPIILYDHAQVAPESPGDFYDATEIDELLTLRTLTLTEEEKREARATDARSAALLERVEQMPPEVFSRLHGALRDLHRAEMVPRTVASGPRPRIGPGTRVRLKPGSRRTDAQDLLFAGCTATVVEVLADVDGRDFLAVTLDGDPGADLHRWYGRHHHYTLDEVEVLEPAAGEEG